MKASSATIAAPAPSVIRAQVSSKLRATWHKISNRSRRAAIRSPSLPVGVKIIVLSSAFVISFSGLSGVLHLMQITN